MNEGIQDDNFESGNNLKKELQSVIDNYVAKIAEIKNLSTRPAGFDSLIEEVKAEGAVTLLLVVDICKTHSKDLENLLPEAKKKMDILSKKMDDITTKLFGVLSAPDFNIINVWSEESSIFEKELKKAENFAKETKNTELESIIKDLRNKFGESMKRMCDISFENKDKISESFRTHLLDQSKEIITQMGEIIKDNKIDSVGSKTKQDFNQLIDTFIYKCEEIVKKARNLYLEDLARLN